jgi:hypothetical protein
MPINLVDQIGQRHAKFLGLLIRDLSYREASEIMSISYDTVKAYGCELMGITGCSTQWELRRWWREHQACWGACVLDDAGVPVVRVHNGACEAHGEGG